MSTRVITVIGLILWFVPTVSMAQTELEKAHAAYQEAFQRYSEAALSASGSEEEFDQLFKEYRSAYAHYKALKNKQSRTETQPIKKALDTTGVDDIATMTAEETCASSAFKALVSEAEDFSNQGQYQQALNTYKEAYQACPDKNLEETMAWLMAQVEPEQQSSKLTAEHHQFGINTPIDHEKAIALYQEQNNVSAWVALADYYLQGVWLERDIKQAKRLLKRAVKQGSIEAQWQLEYLDEVKL